MPIGTTNEAGDGTNAACSSRLSADSNEEELVAAAKSGSADAFGLLVMRYERRIFRLAQNITHNREDAEEAMQNAFIQAFRNLNRFRGDSRFYTWLVRITVNESLMKIRRRPRKEIPMEDSVDAEGVFIPHQVEDWGPTPEERYSQRELQAILDASISELGPIYRTVFQLRDVEGFSTDETAEALSLTTAAVKTRLQRARLQLRSSLNRFFKTGAVKGASKAASAGAVAVRGQFSCGLLSSR